MHIIYIYMYDSFPWFFVSFPVLCFISGLVIQLFRRGNENQFVCFNCVLAFVCKCVTLFVSVLMSISRGTIGWYVICDSVIS